MPITLLRWRLSKGVASTACVACRSCRGAPQHAWGAPAASELGATRTQEGTGSPSTKCRGRRCVGGRSRAADATPAQAAPAAPVTARTPPRGTRGAPEAPPAAAAPPDAAAAAAAQRRRTARSPPSRAVSSQADAGTRIPALPAAATVPIEQAAASSGPAGAGAGGAGASTAKAVRCIVKAVAADGSAKSKKVEGKVTSLTELLDLALPVVQQPTGSLHGIFEVECVEPIAWADLEEHNYEAVTPMTLLDAVLRRYPGRRSGGA